MCHVNLLLLNVDIHPFFVIIERGHRADLGLADWGSLRGLRAGHVGRARVPLDLCPFRVWVFNFVHLLGAAAEAEAEWVVGELRPRVVLHFFTMVVRTGNVWRA